MHDPTLDPLPDPRLRPMRRLAMLASGLILVFVDLRIGGLDVVPDPIGWVLAAAALFGLSGLHPGFRVAAPACVVAVLPALPDLVGAEHDLITVADTLLTTVVVFAVCTAIMALAPERAGAANAIRWIDVCTSVVPLLLVAVPANEAELESLLPVQLIVVAFVLVALVTFIWFLVLLFQVSKRPFTGPGVVLPA